MDWARIEWGHQVERRFPFGYRAPAPDLDPIGFPAPWRSRPWIYANMVASANGVVAWSRSSPDDDPVLAILGQDDQRPERMADRRHMRYLRCFGDVGIGAQTLREQPGLVQRPQEPGEPPAPELYEFRLRHGLPREPRHVVYSVSGQLDLASPLFDAPDADVIVVTTPAGAAVLREAGASARGIDLIVEDVETPAGLRRAHRRLFAERGVRYLNCEGGETMLRALRAADLLDEVFVTVTDVVVDERQHRGVQKIFVFANTGAALIAEGRLGGESAWRFRRWRINLR